MKILKKITLLLLVICLTLCFVGCDKSTNYDNFKPTGVYIVDCINEETYEYDIYDADFAQKMWKRFDELDIYEDPDAEMGEAYLLLKFYDDDLSDVIFTIYENGTCCLNRDYETFYTVELGRTAYVDFCEMYETYDPDAAN